MLEHHNVQFVRCEGNWPPSARCEFADSGSVNAWAQMVSIGIGLCHRCLSPHRRVKSCFCGNARGVCAQRQAWLLCSVSDNADNAFAKVTAPTTLDVLFDLAWCIPPLLPDFRPHCFAVSALACTGRHSKAHDPLNMFNVQFAKRRGRVASKTSWQSCILRDGQFVGGLCPDGVHPKQQIEAVVDL